MRIAYISSSMIPSRRANSVHVMKMGQAFSERIPGFCLLAYSTGIVDQSKLFENYGTNPFDCHLIRYRRIPFYLVYYAMRATKEVLRHRTALVYSRCVHSTWNCLRLGIPTIYEFHSDQWNQQGRIGWLARSILKSGRLTGIVTITQSLRRVLIDAFPQLDSEKTLVAADGADPIPDSSCVSFEHDHDEEKYHIGYVGSLYPGKGIDQVVQVARRLTEEPIQFHVVGGSPEQIKGLQARHQDLPENICFHGYVPHHDVYKYINAFDVCLLPNQRKMRTGKNSRDIASFTSPLKVFEYMAAAKPIVASDLPVLREILNEVNSVLVEPENDEAWASSIMRVCQGRELRKSLSKAVLSDFTSQYTWSSRADRILNWIDNQLSI